MLRQHCSGFLSEAVICLGTVPIDFHCSILRGWGSECWLIALCWQSASSVAYMLSMKISRKYCLSGVELCQCVCSLWPQPDRNLHLSCLNFPLVEIPFVVDLFMRDVLEHNNGLWRPLTWNHFNHPRYHLFWSLPVFITSVPVPAYFFYQLNHAIERVYSPLRQASVPLSALTGADGILMVGGLARFDLSPDLLLISLSIGRSIENGTRTSGALYQHSLWASR